MAPPMKQTPRKGLELPPLPPLIRLFVMDPTITHPPPMLPPTFPAAMVLSRQRFSPAASAFGDEILHFMLINRENLELPLPAEGLFIAICKVYDQSPRGIKQPTDLTVDAISDCFKALADMFNDYFQISMGLTNHWVVQHVDVPMAMAYLIAILPPHPSRDQGSIMGERVTDVTDDGNNDDDINDDIDGDKDDLIGSSDSSTRLAVRRGKRALSVSTLLQVTAPVRRSPRLDLDADRNQTPPMDISDNRNRSSTTTSVASSSVRIPPAGMPDNGNGKAPATTVSVGSPGDGTASVSGPDSDDQDSATADAADPKVDILAPYRLPSWYSAKDAKWHKGWAIDDTWEAFDENVTVPIPTNATLVRLPFKFNAGVSPEKPWKPMTEMEARRHYLPKFTYKPARKVDVNEPIKTLLSGSTPILTGAHLIERLAAFLRCMNIDDPVRLPCPHVTAAKCSRYNKSDPEKVCEDRYHFYRTFGKVTDIKYGDCSYLAGCYNRETCIFMHYNLEEAVKPRTYFDYIKLPFELEWPIRMNGGGDLKKGLKIAQEMFRSEEPEKMPAQWINVNVCEFDFKVIGRFDVVMIDPPWSIHMKLPYNLLSDQQILALPVGKLQTDGIIFLWVTARTMLRGLECLKEWGYRFIDEIIWVKTNQINATVATGRTGHWLNHMKETCLVGIKGSPTGVRERLDLNHVVAPVRETSRKPDAIYGIIDRMFGVEARKLELFGRKHNIRHGWITLGNELPGVNIVDPILARRYRNYLFLQKEKAAAAGVGQSRAGGHVPSGQLVRSSGHWPGRVRGAPQPPSQPASTFRFQHPFQMYGAFAEFPKPPWQAGRGRGDNAATPPPAPHPLPVPQGGRGHQALPRAQAKVYNASQQQQHQQHRAAFQPGQKQQHHVSFSQAQQQHDASLPQTQQQRHTTYLQDPHSNHQHLFPQQRRTFSQPQPRPHPQQQTRRASTGSQNPQPQQRPRRQPPRRPFSPHHRLQQQQQQEGEDQPAVVVRTMAEIEAANAEHARIERERAEDVRMLLDEPTTPLRERVSLPRIGGLGAGRSGNEAS